ncbi:cytochrome P450 [Xylariaceae sp. FL0255]|nr:cytochrome P450 [Xylariaceae sp. FL0255]
MATLQFPFAREGTYNPPKEYEELRRQCPISKVKLPDGDEAWLLTKHDDICAVLGSDKLSADRRAPGYPEIQAHARDALRNARSTLVTLDDPDHARLRKVIEPEFASEAIEKLRLLVHGVVDRALDSIDRRHVQKKEPFDLIEEFAAPIPTQIICKIVGVPSPDVEWLAQDTSLSTDSSREAAEDEDEKLLAYLGRLVDRRIEGKDVHGANWVREGLITKLVREQHASGNLTRDEIVQLVYLVLTAGNAALINSIGLAVLTLFENGEQWAAVRRNPLAFAPRLAAECLRYNAASALDCRRAATGDLTLAGKTIKKGEGVICAVQSADRDEGATPRPEAFDLHRKYDPKDLLGFGYGVHRCLGEHLARMELEIALGTLFARFPGLRSAGDLGILECTPARQNIGVLKLPVVVDTNVELPV